MPKKRNQDLVLEKISEGEPLEEKDCIVVKQLVDKKLLKEEENAIRLTPYGKVIQVMGFKTFEDTEKFERSLTETVPMRTRTKLFFLLTTLVVAITILMLVLEEVTWISFSRS